jgi:hypothetical protein
MRVYIHFVQLIYRKIDKNALDYTSFGFTPGFKPAGFNNTGQNDILMSKGTDVNHFGIGGSGGRLVAFL